MSFFEKIMEVCVRRGIIYPSSEIYGGIAGFYDYGSIGSRIKRNWENFWREWFLSEPNCHEIETSLIMPEKVLIASGHVANFVDPVVECAKCGRVERADHLLESELGENFEGKTPEEMTQIIRKHGLKCECGGEYKEVDVINLMFPIEIGAYKNIKAYLRPETAQGAYVSFKREYRINREKLPLGLAIIGKAFRNEISPRQGVLRMREFTQAELQVFFDPETIDEHPDYDSVKDIKVQVLRAGEKDMETVKIKDLALPKMYSYFMGRIKQFFDALGYPDEVFRFRELSEEERAFYNKYHWDIEIYFRSYDSFKEVAGLHYRTDHDLKGHQKYSGVDHRVSERKFVPHVIEVSFGVDRNVFSLLDVFYREEEDKKYFALPKQVAPYIAGVYPLVNKDNVDKKAWEIYQQIKSRDVFYDDKGSIGRRYARADEIGVYYGITIDYQTLEDNTVTVRNRDTKEQERVSIEKLGEYLCRC